MAIVQGVVEYHGNSKFGGQSIKVNGAFYNSKYEIKCERGDEVEFDDGGKNYCRKLKVVASGGGGASAPSSSGVAPKQGSTHSGKMFPLPLDHPDRSIIRQNALAHATKLYVEGVEGQVDPAIVDMRTAADEIVEIARIFEEYSSGFAELEEAKKMKVED